MKTVIFYFEYLFFRFVIFIVNLFPFPTVLKWADSLGPLIQKIAKRKNDIALENLREAYRGEKSEAEIQQIARKSFINLAKLAFEFVRIPEIAANPEKYIRFVDQNYIWKALDQKRGAILLISHFGNWELMAVRSAWEGLPMNAVARPLKNPFVYDYVKKLRGYTGLHTIAKQGAAREMLKTLNKNECVAILIDQRESQTGIPVNFFGRPALTTALPAMLALKKDIPVIPCFHYRNPEGKTTLICYEPFRLVRTGNEEEDIRANTQMFASKIENEVRKDPANWLWMHRRWRL